MANHQRAFMPSQKETTYFANFRGEFKLKKRGLTELQLKVKKTAIIICRELLYLTKSPSRIGCYTGQEGLLGSKGGFL